MDFYPKLELSQAEEDNAYKNALLEEAGLGRFIRIAEVWDIPYSSGELSYKTHSLLRFFGKFPPPVPNYLIEKYTRQGDLVLDPMCGSGTSAVECMLNKRKIICADVSPLSQLLVNVSCQYLPANKLLKTLKMLNEKYKNKSHNHGKMLNIPLKEKTLYHWFLPETVSNMHNLLNIINEIKDEKLKNVFLAIMVSIVRKVSKATSLQGRLFLDVVTAQKDPIEEFNKSAVKIIKKIGSLPENATPPEFILEDIRKLDLKGMAPKLVICHPPYFNVYKFSSIFLLELAWLSCDKKSISEFEIREFFKVGKKQNVHKYVEDLSQGICNLSDQLKKGSIFSLMIGDTRIRGEFIQTTKLLLDNIKDSGLTLKSLAIRKPKYTEASWVASQRRTGKTVGVSLSDYVLIFEKAK